MNGNNLDVELADFSIVTSPAPAFLQAYQFKVEKPEGEKKHFDLIDGGVAANIPVSRPSRPLLVTEPLLPTETTN